MSESFEQLRLEFLAETEDTLEELQRDLNRLGEGVGETFPSSDVVDRVFRTTHSLKGVAGMFGLEDISAVSHVMENVFDELREGRLELDHQLLDLLFQGNESLHRLLSLAAGRAVGDPRTEATGVIDKIERYLGEHASPGGVAFDDEAENPLEDTLPHLSESERDGILQAARDGKTIAIIEASFPQNGFEDPFRQLLHGARGWGVVHGTIPGEHDEDDNTFRIRLVASGEDVVFPLLKATDPLGARVITCDTTSLLANAADEHSEESSESAAPPAEASTAATPERVAEAILPEVEFEPIGSDPLATTESFTPEARSSDSSENETPRARRSPPPKPLAVSSGTLRVPVERVDRLLSELAELMQAKMGLENSAREILESFRDRVQRTELSQSLRNLDRSIRALHDEILRVRLVTLTSQFQKLERTIRETSRATGREARLVTSEEGVELDKRIVDALTDPLVHLVRNAVDHGLEDAAARQKAGKDPIGTVRIDAYPEGSYTVIEVSDDGSGIDVDRVLAKARRVGLVSPQVTPTQTELLEMVFHPGFTVRENATEISGRGVGLDAVRDAITSLGGLIDVDTSPQGTRFRLRLPTTLAITQGLLVDVAEQPFFLPLSSVMEVAQISPDRIESFGEEELIVFEQRGVPVRDLGELLDLPPIERDRGTIRGVLIGLAEQRLFLLVEDLGGQREIVVRSLGELLPPIPGISGSTELGDGRTVLILDPAALFELAYTKLPGVEI